MCVITYPADTVAAALNMSASDLRLALVSGKTVSDIAASKNVDIKVIQDALATQRQAALDQALKDGLLTQAEYDAIAQAMKNRPVDAQNEIRVPAHNTVNQEVVAAQAIGISCAWTPKTNEEEAGGRSLVVNGSRGVSPAGGRLLMVEK